MRLVTLRFRNFIVLVENCHWKIFDSFRLERAWALVSLICTLPWISVLAAFASNLALNIVDCSPCKAMAQHFVASLLAWEDATATVWGAWVRLLDSRLNRHWNDAADQLKHSRNASSVSASLQSRFLHTDARSQLQRRRLRRQRAGPARPERLVSRHVQDRFPASRQRRWVADRDLRLVVKCLLANAVATASAGFACCIPPR